MVAFACEFSSFVLRSDPLIFQNSESKNKNQKIIFTGKTILSSLRLLPHNRGVLLRHTHTRTHTQVLTCSHFVGAGRWTWGHISRKRILLLNFPFLAWTAEKKIAQVKTFKTSVKKRPLQKLMDLFFIFKRNVICEVVVKIVSRVWKMSLKVCVLDQRIYFSFY